MPVDCPVGVQVTVIKVVENVIVQGEIKMGFRKPMDYNQVHHQLYMSGVELHSPYNDGFVQWAIKQELYQIKWLVDSILKDSPTFSGEDEFLEEQEKKVVWRTLSK